MISYFLVMNSKRCNKGPHKNEKVSKPLLKKITCREEVKLVSVDVGHDE